MSLLNTMLSVHTTDDSDDPAATMILNDDVDGAEAGLNKGVSSFHKVCV